LCLFNFEYKVLRETPSNFAALVTLPAVFFKDFRENFFFFVLSDSFWLNAISNIPVHTSVNILYNGYHNNGICDIIACNFSRFNPDTGALKLTL
jgi:hypothetical protein